MPAPPSLGQVLHGMEQAEQLHRDAPDESTLPNCVCSEKSWQNRKLHRGDAHHFFTHSCKSCGRCGLLMTPPTFAFFVSSSTDGQFTDPEFEYMEAILGTDLSSFRRGDSAPSGAPESLTYYAHGRGKAWVLAHEAS